MNVSISDETIAAIKKLQEDREQEQAREYAKSETIAEIGRIIQTIKGLKVGKNHDAETIAAKLYEAGLRIEK